MNTPPGASPTFIIMTANADGGGATVGSGLNYFASQALLYSPTSEVDTAKFVVALQNGAAEEDINIVLEFPESALDDYYFKDSLDYVMMPDSTYDIVSTTATIKKGETYAVFKVAFYPVKIDFTKNYMLPITASNSADLMVSSNYGFMYYHIVGNPIAGAYNWDFIRCSTPTCSGGPDGLSFYGDHTIFSPVNGTTVTVPTGYYDHANYIITFDDDGNGNLSNFKAVIDPASVTGNWAANGITIASGPTIVVENNYTKFTLHYTTATRNCTDIYYK